MRQREDSFHDRFVGQTKHSLPRPVTVSSPVQIPHLDGRRTKIVSFKEERQKSFEHGEVS